MNSTTRTARCPALVPGRLSMASSAAAEPTASAQDTLKPWMNTSMSRDCCMSACRSANIASDPSLTSFCAVSATAVLGIDSG